MLPRSIVHLDADAFFASVEQAADSRLRGKPVAVGGEKRGIIASASYEARKFGVFTPDVEIASIDEGYFDLSGVRKPSIDVAQIIRAAIRQSLKISVSEGIGS